MVRRACRLEQEEKCPPQMDCCSIVEKTKTETGINNMFMFVYDTKCIVDKLCKTECITN